MPIKNETRILDKEIQEALAGAGLREIVDALPNFVWLIDENRKILFANSRARRWTEEEAARKCERIHSFQPLGKEVLDSLVEMALLDGNSRGEEIYDRFSHRWFLPAIYLTGSNTRDGRRILIYIIQETTKQKQNEIEIKKSADRYRLLFNACKDVLVQLDKYGNIIDVNDRVRQVGGYEKEYLIGKSSPPYQE